MEGIINRKVTVSIISVWQYYYQILSEWLRLMCRDDLANKPNMTSYRICETHFKEQDILPTTNRKVLKKNSLPSLDLPDFKSTIQGSSRNEDKQTQTENAVSDSHTHTKKSLPCSTSKKRKSKNDHIECRKKSEIYETENNTQETEESLIHSSRKEDKRTQPENAVRDNYTQTTRGLLCGTRTKRKLEKEILECRKKLKLYETGNKPQETEKSNFHELCDKFLSKELALVVKQQTDLKSRASGNRYDTDYIFFCLKLYFTSQQAYRFLQRALCLPCKKTLYKHLFPITTGINERAMTILKMKVEQMTETEKNCSVMIDAMKLKVKLPYDVKKVKGGPELAEPANHALVVMVRGILVDWKQPIAYKLLSESRNDDEITEWVDNVLETLFKIGLNIRTFVSGQGSDVWDAANTRSVSLKKPYFFVNNSKIYYIFDAPHLIKDVRNNLMQYDFHFGNSIAKYEHIVQFYNQDIKKSCRLAHKLTDSHIKPTKFEMKEVRYATQLFSKSVATGICTYIDDNVIGESGRDTADFITMMNDLFDSLNSSNLRHNYEHKRAYAGRESQTTFFREMLSFFEDLQIIDPNDGSDITSNVRFIEGFQITITSLTLLLDDLRTEECNFLFTRRFNKDALENLFELIRTKIGVAMNPTSRQFESEFKKIYFSNIIKPTQSGHCADDSGELLEQSTLEESVTEPIDDTSDTDHEES